MTQGYKIGVGWNVALLSLVDIETISVSGQKFAGPKVVPFYDDGVEKIRLAPTSTGELLFSGGFANIDWLFGFLYYPQYDYLSTTYCNGRRSGQVTLYTTLLNTVTFSRMNAIMILPKPPKQGLAWYPKLPVHFIKLAVAS